MDVPCVARFEGSDLVLVIYSQNGEEMWRLPLEVFIEAASRAASLLREERLVD